MQACAMDSEADRATTRSRERQSAAVTLSDMEIFIFPELMYSLVLANIMSPRIWRWRDDPWFKGIHRMPPHRRLQRVRQYIMDHYVFNLDLETWGLTSQQRELDRFSAWLDPGVIKASNALFGYEGDRYYFDIDIRTHFGLDKYHADVIPYWKTETVEAMDAFRFRPGYETGAGECVSLAALYAAALYIVAEIPLEQIYLIATPLHSQNFIDLADGILINNRRLVTKTMWFNGTQISAQARRALENERVTIVTHATGWIHTLYRRATIAPAAYARFSERLHAFLQTPITAEILGNFLRQSDRCRACFVLRHRRHGVDRYLPLDVAFAYEQDCKWKVTDNTRAKLLDLIPDEAYDRSCKCQKIVLDDVEAYLREHPVAVDRPDELGAVKRRIGSLCMRAEEMLRELVRFCRTEPRLPAADGVVFAADQAPLDLAPGLAREAVIGRLEKLRGSNITADLAFHAWRDLSRTDNRPFIQAALERNPVCIGGAAAESLEALAARLATWPGASIYDEPERLAQPDEVWNFQRGDGFEKALLLANVARARGEGTMTLTLDGGQAILDGAAGALARFASAKTPAETVWSL